MVFKGSFLLSFLICLFAIGSWVDLNGVWVELPLLVNHLPERWKLPTFVVTIVQLANIAPLIYMGVFHCGKFRNMERYTIYLILSIGCICCVLLAIFWNYTLEMNIFGQKSEYSVAFFILIWFLSMIDTTSSVTFLPYLVNYPRYYITALYVGEGLSGFFPGVMGLIQGAGGEGTCTNVTTVVNGTEFNTTKLEYPSPRLTVSAFFSFLGAMLIMCLISFSLVDNCKYFRRFQLKKQSSSRKILLETQFSENESETEVAESLLPSNLPKNSKRKCIIFVLLVAYINFFTNGVLPSIQNYSLMPYSTYLYHIVVSVSQILNPLACLLTIRQWKVNTISITAMTLVASIGTGYLLFLATQSPLPILNNTIFGQILAAFSWFFVCIMFSFEKTILAIELQKQGHTWLQFCGAATQIGSAVGALLIFICVVILNLFKSKPSNC